MLLDAPHGVAIDQPRVVIQRFDLLVQRIDFSPVLMGQREIFRHGLRTDVAEIDETAGNRQIRRWRQRRHRLRGVHRVDKHEVGAGLLLASTSMVFRSSKSPTPQDPLERMEYSWLIHPHREPFFISSSSSIFSGALITVAVSASLPTVTSRV